MSNEDRSGSRDETSLDEGAEPAGVSRREIEDIGERSQLRAPVIYEIVRREGEMEMARPATSLWWSGVAAGLSISFSLLAQAVLYIHLPAAGWRPLVAGFGYSVGFLMAVLARQQLFTETTITIVLPVVAEFTAENLRGLLRTWVIVLAANLTGTLFAALFCNFTPVLTPELRGAMIEISREMIAIGGFTHIIAGSMEAFLLLVGDKLGPGDLLIGFILPVPFGNVVGGTALFALISYAQVMREM